MCVNVCDAWLGDLGPTSGRHGMSVLLTFAFTSPMRLIHVHCQHPLLDLILV